MWGVVNIMQIIVYYNFIKVRLVAHAELFLTKLKVIALGEFIPSDKIANKINEIFQEKFDVNFEEANSINDLGSTFLIIAGLVFFAIIVTLLGLVGFLNKKVKFISKLKAKLFWNSFIRCSL